MTSPPPLFCDTTHGMCQKLCITVVLALCIHVFLYKLDYESASLIVNLTSPHPMGSHPIVLFHSFDFMAIANVPHFDTLAMSHVSCSRWAERGADAATWVAISVGHAPSLLRHGRVAADKDTSVDFRACLLSHLV
ncbi:hypothetical protein RB195_019365 [Necator americanus]|uniref:Uncharacterized protein n=1 Tax=Necator americanus TaxID=51031 RepID=A0ABR1CDT9_NECAM